jgi:L-threonylcarbamoyladenylate synthase
MSARLPIDIKEQIENAIAILKRGGLVTFPTDTVYGLGACFSNPEAVERVYWLKKRARSMGMPLLVADESQINEVAVDIPQIARLLIKRFMPGGLTLILPRASTVPDAITGGGETVAVRIPAHPVPIALIKGLGMPITGTSANKSGQTSALTANEVNRQFGGDIDLVIDGRCDGGIESTIVDVTADVPRLLREGAVSRAELEQVCPIL